MKKHILFTLLFALIFVFPALAANKNEEIFIEIGQTSFYIGCAILAVTIFVIYKSTNNNLSILEQKNKELTDQINHLKTQMLNSNKQENSNEQELKSSISSLNQKISESAQQLSEKESAYIELQREYAQIYQEYTRLIVASQKKQETAQKKILALEKEITNLKKEYDDLKSVFAQRTQELSELQQAYDTLRASLSTLDSAEYKMLKPYISEKEYRELSQVQVHRLALERYNRRQRSEWEVGLDFERYIGYRYEKRGFAVEYVGATQGLKDMGRDLIVSKESGILIIQCKRWARGSQIHEKHIFQLQGTLTLYQKQHPEKAVSGIFITTASLSPKAKETAQSLGIRALEHFAYSSHPLVKCKADSKRYYLPMDPEYDKISISFTSGDNYHKTVESALSSGFISAYE